MPRSREFQVENVYGAEKEVGEGEDLVTLRAVTEYVEKITGSRWWKNHCAVSAPVSVRGSRKTYAEADFDGIYLPTHMRAEMDVLHELAHVICFRANKHPHHGRDFALTYLLLTARFMGQDHARELRESFKRFHVEYSPRHPRRPKPNRAHLPANCSKTFFPRAAK